MREHLKKRVQEEEKGDPAPQADNCKAGTDSDRYDRIEECSGRYTLKKLSGGIYSGYLSDIYEGLRQWFSMSSEVSGLDMTYFYNQFSVRNGQLRAGD